MRKILLVSGCSFTTDNYVSWSHPELNCGWPKWPELLAEKLDMDVVNLGQSGQGNEFIFSSIYDYIANNDTRNIGYVLAAWSQVQRRDYTVTKYGRKRWSSDHYEMRGDLYYSIEKSLRYYGMFQMLMEKYRLRYKQFQMIEPFKDNFGNNNPGAKLNNHVDRKVCINMWENSPLSKIIKKEHFIGWPSHQSIDGGFSMQGAITKNRTNKQYDISEQDSHPNAVGHEKYAEFIKRYL